MLFSVRWVNLKEIVLYLGNCFNKMEIYMYSGTNCVFSPSLSQICFVLKY